jgi:DNA polymerase-3 subunit gamma/tau
MPAASRYRVYIIDEVHMLTLPAFNALLKTLEEPPPHVKFIFATTESHKVPVTILSRCQRFDFRRIPTSQIVSHLERVSREEDLRISESGLALIGRQAQGSMRDAESLLDQVVSFTGKEVTDRHITEILGIIDRDLIFQASLGVIEGSAARCLEIVNRMYHYGHDIKEFYRSLMEQFRNLMVSLVASEGNLLDMTEEDRRETRRQAELAGFEKLQTILNFLVAREEPLRFSTHPRLLLEATLVKLCQMGKFLSFDELLARIDSLEKRLLHASTGPGCDPTARVSDTTASWKTSEEESEPGKASETSLGGRDWDGFLSHMSSKNKGMANILKEWTFQKLDEKVLEIACGDKPFSSTYFNDAERYQQLSAYCGEYFGAGLKVRLKEAAAVTQHEPSDKGSPELPPPVMDVLQAFQGEIRRSGSEGGPAMESRQADEGKGR